MVHFLVNARLSEATDTEQLVLGPLFWLKTKKKECLVLEVFHERNGKLCWQISL